MTKCKCKSDKDPIQEAYLQSLELENKQLLEKVAALEKALEGSCKKLSQIKCPYIICDDQRCMMRDKPALVLRTQCWTEYFMGEK